MIDYRMPFTDWYNDCVLNQENAPKIPAILFNCEDEVDAFVDFIKDNLGIVLYDDDNWDEYLDDSLKDEDEIFYIEFMRDRSVDKIRVRNIGKIDFYDDNVITPCDIFFKDIILNMFNISITNIELMDFLD